MEGSDKPKDGWGAWLKELRLAAQLRTQEEAEEAIRKRFPGDRTTAEQIGKYENEATGPRLDKLWRLTAAYGVKLPGAPPLDAAGLANRLRVVADEAARMLAERDDGEAGVRDDGE